MRSLVPRLPHWLRGYGAADFSGDLAAALVVTLLLVPQGLAYAALAGLPPQLGLYASLLPLVVYALFGSSMVMSVGPVAVASLMTAAALEPIAAPGSADYIAGAILLALLSGIMLFVFGLLRLGELARFLSHPVVSGFISGAALLIIISQLRPLLGIEAQGPQGLALAAAVFRRLDEIQPLTAALGVSTLMVLALARRYLAGGLQHLGLAPATAGLITRLVPMAAVLVTIGLVSHFGWAGRVEVVGQLPAGLPEPTLPVPDWNLMAELWLPALLIGLVGFVESISIAQAFARRQGRRIDPDAELRGLGAANIASAFSGAFPVTGGFSRTAVNAEAGARTPLSGILAAVLIALVLLFAGGLFSALPMAVLAATIMVAAAGLVDWKTLHWCWRYDRAEALALAGTAAGVLFAGVEVGIGLGVGLSLAILVWRAGHPHIAELGRVPDTEHFRNVDRHPVATHPAVLLLRVDENLFFGNAEAVEDRLLARADREPEPRHLVLVMSSVSQVDATAVDMLERLDDRLRERGIRLHLAEVKGPVRDRLERVAFLERLSGKVWLSTQSAFEKLSG